MRPSNGLNGRWLRDGPGGNAAVRRARGGAPRSVPRRLGRAVGSVALSALLAAAACSRQESPGPPTAPEAGDAAQAPAGPAAATPLLPALVGEPFTADLPEMRERKLVRALVSINKTDFFFEKGRPLGLQAEALAQFEKFLNEDVSQDELRIRVVYVPLAFEQLLPGLLEGRGDVAAAFLTITPERERQVAFATGRSLSVNEVVVTRAGVTGLDSIDDLAGRRVLLLRGSSYTEHLRDLDQRLRRQGRPPIRILEAEAHLTTEDILEYVNAGTVEITVADDFRARLWADVLPNIAVREDLVVHSGGTMGWAVRRQNPELQKALNEFLGRVKKGTLVGNVLFKRYYQDTRWIEDATDPAEQAKLERFKSLFRRYGDRYGFDWLAIAAQAYQESGLDQSKRSRVGAIGLMQILPSTARGPRVGIPDVTDVENNVHAGVKYLAFLRDHYFSDPALAEEDRVAFAWAAYNAGPAKVRRMRARTSEMGLDPNHWFHNVEYGALATVGREPVRYVANIYKHYVAYQLAQGLRPPSTERKL